MSQLKPPRTVTNCAGKSPFDVTEELSFNQVVR